MPIPPRPVALPETGTLLKEHNISQEEFEIAQIEWETLRSIHSHHIERAADLQTTGEAISKCLQGVPEVHSLRIRVKHPDHLIAKIIRKKSEDPTLPISLETYAQHITDLIGVRAIHLFKDDWLPIHEFVQAQWDLHETPLAYVRKGDPEAITDGFRTAGCEVKEHGLGYRSIHYLLKSQLRKTVDLIELQVRTIFEEGWSEIDHQLRYPRRSEDPSLAAFLAIFNRTAGSADEMGTFAKFLSEAIAKQLSALAEAQRELDELVSKLNLKENERSKLHDQIEQLKKSSHADPLSVTSVPLAVHGFAPDVKVTTALHDLLKDSAGWHVTRSLALSNPRTCSNCGYSDYVGLTRYCNRCGKPL